jgi:peptidoglycan/LPS O-acetylase OafA/YrhL
LIARIIQTGQWPSLSLRWVAIPVVLGFLALPLLPTAYGFGAALAVPAGLMLASVAMGEIRGRLRWLGTPAIVELGNHTYALYLVHVPIHLVFMHLMGTGEIGMVPRFLIALAVIILSLLSAKALYTYVESPLVRRFARSRARKIDAV